MIRTQAKSINDDGTILGYAVKTGEASQRPATWRNGTWTLLSVPTEVSASLRFNDGAKINASGETLVSVNFNTNIRWLNNIPSVLRPPLGTTLAAEAPYTATHMDNRGRVVGGYTYGAAGQYPLPFLWQRTSEYATIQDLPLGAIAGIMHRINDSGNIIGYAQDPTRGYEMAPVIWRRGIPRYLREVCPELRRGLPPYYGAQALALWDRVLDINNKDVVVGTALYLNSNHEWVRLPVQCKQGKMTAFELPSTYVGGDAERVDESGGVFIRALNQQQPSSRLLYWKDGALIDVLAAANLGANIQVFQVLDLNQHGQILIEVLDGKIYKSLLLSPTVELLDPVPKAMAGATIDQGKLISDLTTESSVGGVSADGVATVIIRIAAGEVGQTFHIAFDEATCSFASSGIVEACGALGVLGQPTISRSLVVQAVSTARGPAAFAVYRAPRDFTWDRTHEELDRRVVTLTLTSATDTVRHDIYVIRPLVVFVHGLWATSSDLGVLPNLGGSERLFSSKRVNYGYPINITASTPPVSAGMRDWLPPRGSALGIRHAAESVIRQVGLALSDFRRGSNVLGTSVAAAKVDMVGHSMGALVARAIANRSDYTEYDTHAFGSGILHKIISIGGPHLGSPFASMLHSPYTGLRDMLGAVGYYTFYDCDKCVDAWSPSIPDGRFVGAGAVGDLRGRVDGTDRSRIIEQELMKPSRNIVPIAYIAGQLPESTLKAFDEPAFVIGYKGLESPNPRAPRIKWMSAVADKLGVGSDSARFASRSNFEGFASRQTDGLVALHSQLNGLNQARYPLSPIDGVAHSSGAAYLFGVAGNALDVELGTDVASVVRYCLNARVDSAIFDRR